MLFLMQSNRREMLRRAFLELGVFASGASLIHCGTEESVSPAPGTPPRENEFPAYDPPSINPPSISNIPSFGPLGDPDDNGVRLPEGFTARIVARSGEKVEGTDHIWHPAPDGGATFLAEDGGYVYVSNSERPFDGGVGVLRFDASGHLEDAYSILEDTMVNCAGGAMPWGTWLSCEEAGWGRVFECDPFGRVEAIERPALGYFKHEAAALDPERHHLYLTEDEEDGLFYRFTPSALLEGRADLFEGKLEVMRVLSGEEGAVEWLEVPDRTAEQLAIRQQLPEATRFDGGEGIGYRDGVVFFTTKGDNRVWAFDVEAQEITIVYDDDLATEPVLTGVDNLHITAGGDLLIAEDGGDMQIVAITPDGRLVPIVQLVDQEDSEITGPALDPYRERLYFSSQRGTSGGILGDDGITYEITGPFFV